MEALYSEIHDAEAHRIITTGWLRDVYPVRSTAEAAVGRDDEDYARLNACTELRMDTNARNLAARNLYAKLGYREIGIVSTVFNGIPGVQLVLLEKHI